MRTRIAIVVTVILFVMLGFWCYRPSLHVASFYGSTAHARLYLMLGADVNRRKSSWLHSTPLDLAKTPEMITLLKQHGGEYSGATNMQFENGQSDGRRLTQ